MGLWIKNDDGSIEKVAGSGGGGGSFEGEHVLTGDVANPPEDLAVGQLMWDGVEGGSGGGDAGPHDHNEYALVEHDHDEFTHDHDYLPLTGGTVTGDLQVDGQVLAARGTADAPGLSFASFPGTGFYPGSTNVATHVNGVWQFVVYDDKTRVIRDLEVGGNLQVAKQTTASQGVNFGGNWSGSRIYGTPTAGREFLVVGDAAVGGQIQVYGNNDSKQPGRVHVTGSLYVNDQPLGRFAAADGIDTADVLDRAETATMPAVDDEGVATTDAEVEGITVNEVVTALLLKVKELSAEVEELKGN